MDGFVTTDNTIRANNGMDGVSWTPNVQPWSEMPVYPSGPAHVQFTKTTGGKTMNAITTTVPAVGGFRPQIRTSSGEVLWEGSVVRKQDKAFRAAEKHLDTKLREMLNA